MECILYRPKEGIWKMISKLKKQCKLLFGACCLASLFWLDFLVSQNMKPIESDGGVEDGQLGSELENSSLTSSCTDHKEYPFPTHNSGLPYLADAFASHDAHTVTFIGRNRGKCEEEWKQADSFATYRDEEYHRFMCVFHTTSNDRIHVLSDYIYSTNPHDPVYLIQCKLPAKLRHLVEAGQTMTSLHVDLHAMEDLEVEKAGRNNIRPFNGMEIDLLPSIPNIPVCHPASIHTTKDKNFTSNKFKLIGYLPVSSNYALDSRKGAEKSTLWSSVNRIPEWIAWHQFQGFEHFIVYDNDKEPHGPIEKILQPHIESGLVSYRWFPIENCMSSVENRRMDEAQISGSLAALHRIGYASEFLSYTDGDEFFVPLKDGENVLSIAEAIFARKPEISAIEWIPTVMAPCNGTRVEAGGSILKKWKCLTDQHYAAMKLIVRTSTMFYFCIHYAVLTKDGNTAETYELNDSIDGYLAHYRAQNDPESSSRDGFSGLVRNEWTKKVTYFDEFLRQERKKNKSREKKSEVASKRVRL